MSAWRQTARLYLRASALLARHHLRRLLGWVERHCLHWQRTRWNSELVASYHKRFQDGEYCEHCAGIHLGKCPRIKRAVFRSDGHLQEVEYWPWDAWPTEHILFEWMLPEE